MSASPAAPAGTSHTHGVSSPALLDETIGDNLDATAARFPGNEALVDVPTDRRWTYQQLVADVDRLARALLTHGVRPGDRVGIWSPNCAEWVLVQFATAKIGAILVNVNPAYRTHEVGYVINQSGISVMVAAESFKTSDYPAMLREVADDCPSMRSVVVFGQQSWDDLLAGADDATVEALAEVQAGLEPGDAINIQYTSGTTGFPKGATLSHRNILNNGYFVGEGCRYTDADRICIPVPFYHCFGMVMGNLACHHARRVHGHPGARVRPGARPCMRCSSERCTSLYGVPTMFIAELVAP